jgi:hypothetical protein
MLVFINDEGKSLVTTQRKQDMLTNSKIVLSVALVLATASAAAAVPQKQAVRHQTATARQLHAATYLRISSARFSGSVNGSGYMKIQTQSYWRDNVGWTDSLGY